MEILVEGILDYCEVKEWKKRYFVMKYEVTSGIRYIEFYKDKNWRKQLPKHVVNLHPGYEVKRIKNDPKKKYRFTIKTTDHSLTLASDDENIMNQWLATLEEYNLVKSFCVEPQDSPTMLRINAVYPCHLQLVQSEVRLVSAMDGKLLGMWPFKCIRRYKFTGNVFCIEAGRKAPTGEGLFEFISNECSEIYRVMDTIIRSKAGDSTMRRLASEKIQKSVDTHDLVRKTQSVPPTPQKPGVSHYDYATPNCTISELAKANQRSVNLPRLPEQSPPTGRGLEIDPSYNVLYPNESSFESQSKDEDSSYDTLQFNTPSTAQENNDLHVDDDSTNMQASGGGGAYDTLFNQALPKRKSTDGKASILTTGRSESYDKLQFSRSRTVRNNSSSGEVDTCVDNRTNDSESHATSDGVYNTLNHLQISQPSVPSKMNTYDCLADSTNLSQPDANTYDSLELDDAKSTDKKLKHPVLEKPVAPARPPPRKKSGNLQEEVPHSKKAVPSKPGRLAKLRKAPTPDNNDGKVASKLSTQNDTRDIIQQKLNKPVDDTYATADHEYASIDYSAVSRLESEPSSDALYSEPSDRDGTTPTHSSPPKPVKPKRNAPKLMKIFKKTHTPPSRAKTPDGDVNFADELKKKLEKKLKKSDGSGPKTSKSGRTEGQNVEEELYDEVNDSQETTYSEPFNVDDEMDV